MPIDQLDTDLPESEEDDSEENDVSEYQDWVDKIQKREKEFESGWWKAADKAVELYDGGSRQEDSDDQAYNILYSNTEVLLPSLYSATPKPDVRPRYPDTDLKAIPAITNRFLQALSDPAVPGLESLDDAMGETTLSSLIAGMGFSRLRHYPDRKNPIAVEAGYYKGLIWAKGRKWSKLPWIAFRHELSPDELFAQFDIPEDQQHKFKLDDDQDPSDEKVRDKPPLGTVVYELWCKKEREIYFLCPDWKDILLREDPDTLKLEGFYPTPGMVLLTNQPGQIIPVPLYQYYRNQAQELNRVTVRLNKVLSAIRVRGAYNGLLGDDMQKLLSDSELENALVPASEAGILAAQGGGFDRHIWLLPLEKLVQVATQLYQARQQIKQVIYELTGISDIIRGSSVASETATAQDLKNKWGTIRLRKMQAIVANYVRDVYRLAVDAGTQVIPAEDWQKITQLPIPTEKEQAVAKQQLQYLQMQQQQQMQQYQQMAMMAQAQNQPVPPPPQPQPGSH